LLERIAEDLVELAVVEQHPLQDGRNMTMMLAPSKALLSDLAKAASASPNGKARTDAAVPEEAVAEPEMASDGSAPEPVAEPAAADPAPADSPQED
jgi:translation initiation factor IF-3